MLRNTPTAYGAVAIVLHWTIAILFLMQIVLGYLTQATKDNPRLQFDIYQWHKSFGFLVLVFALLRLVWSLSNARPLPLADTPRREAAVARAAHTLLLVLTLAVPLAGWMIASTSPLKIPSFVFDFVLIPDLPATRSDASEAFWSRTHAFLAYGTGLLVLAHAGAAIHHHMLRRDITLLRMLGISRTVPRSQSRDV